MKRWRRGRRRGSCSVSCVPPPAFSFHPLLSSSLVLPHSVFPHLFVLSVLSPNIFQYPESTELLKGRGFQLFQCRYCYAWVQSLWAGWSSRLGGQGALVTGQRCLGGPMESTDWRCSGAGPAAHGRVVNSAVQQVLCVSTASLGICGTREPHSRARTPPLMASSAFFTTPWYIRCFPLLGQPPDLTRTLSRSGASRLQKETPLSGWFIQFATALVIPDRWDHGEARATLGEGTDFRARGAGARSAAAPGQPTRAARGRCRAGPGRTWLRDGDRGRRGSAAPPPPAPAGDWAPRLRRAGGAGRGCCLLLRGGAGAAAAGAGGERPARARAGGVAGRRRGLRGIGGGCGRGPRPRPAAVSAPQPGFAGCWRCALPPRGCTMAVVQ